MPSTPLKQLQNLRKYFETGITRPYSFRKARLQDLYDAIKLFEKDIFEALQKDLHKSNTESFTSEVGVLYAEISHTLDNLESWMEPETVSTPLALQPATSKIVKDPLGVVLVIAPWNYPFQLLFAPLVGAIAGGNCAVLKPSEFTPHVTAVAQKIIAEAFDNNYVLQVEGDGALVVPELMDNFRFDHVFFTGSIPVGKEIAKMAAKDLVPVTLELGGKSPCIVDKSASIKVAAQRIAWGKFTNAGQTCVAPDYLLVHESKKDELLNHITGCITKMFGPDPKQSNDFGRIINEKRFDTLSSYLTKGKVVTGGEYDKSTLYIAPTILDGIDATFPIMQEEIFGPILPVITYKEHDEVLAQIAQNPFPLSLYLFTQDSKTEKLYTEKVLFGGGCINNTLMHWANPELPIGGVAYSGLGQYHGKYSFNVFTRPKGILKSATWTDPALKYPPYKNQLKLFKWLMK